MFCRWITSLRFFFPLEISRIMVVMHLLFLTEFGSSVSVQILKHSSKSRQNFRIMTSQSSVVLGIPIDSVKSVMLKNQKISIVGKQIIIEQKKQYRIFWKWQISKVEEK
jgi:hypothetical protein